VTLDFPLNGGAALLEKTAMEMSKSNTSTITMSPEQTLQFQKAIKVGIYRELHRKGLLTDAQLNQLISIQNQ
jgi:hypothetical protein